jgi:hypothetical protein
MAPGQMKRTMASGFTSAGVLLDAHWQRSVPMVR